MEEKTWDKIFDNLDWDSVDKGIEEMRKHDELLAYFDQDQFDYKRSYIRKLMQTHPEIFDRDVIDMATEQMMESHDGGVELGVDDALRFVANQKPMTAGEAAKLLADVGINDDNIEDVLFNDESEGGRTIDGVKNMEALKKAKVLTRCADILANNADVVLLGVPVFDIESNWTQAKLAFFSENLSKAEKNVLQKMMDVADKPRMKIEHGVAVVMFQIYNIWSNFE